MIRLKDRVIVIMGASQDWGVASRKSFQSLSLFFAIGKFDARA
jgi:hypothetical protein